MAGKLDSDFAELAFAGYTIKYYELQSIIFPIMRHLH